MKTNEDILNIVFKVRDELEYEVNESGIVTILEKQDHKIQQIFRKLRFNIPKYKKMELDEYSSEVFLLIDGNRTVEEIGIHLERKFGDKVNPLYERLLVFLNHIDVNCKYIEKVNNEGIVTILEKQDHKIQNFLRKMKFSIPQYKKIELDEYCSIVFLLIDGNRTVKEIGKSLDEKYRCPEPSIR